MAILTFEEIKQLIISDCPDWVKVSRKKHLTYETHVNGIGTADYLAQIEGYENERQYYLRKKFATSNKFVFENLLRPVDKVFSANGGSVVINTKTDASKQLLQGKIAEFSGGLSLRQWVANVQANKYYSDPSGLIFFEWDKTETYPTFKSINAIKNYKADGRKIEWVLFEGIKKIKADGSEYEGLFYRFVDSQADYLFYELNKEITQIEEQTFENPFDFVPAIINSDIPDSSLKFTVSPIEPVIELADHYLITTSVKNIYEFLHGYPIFWAYVQPCRHCDGTGLYQGETCTVCGGEGHTFKKDVSNVMKLKPPTSNDEPKLAPDIAGYVQPDLETWKEQRTELDWIWGLMHFTMWGTTQERAENETATAAFIDVQPVNDKLNRFADAYEQTEKLIIDVLGKFYVRENYESSSVNYGRRFLVESPDAIWKKYEAAKTAGAPKITLDYLLTQFYQSEFKNDVQAMIIAIKGIYVEPFVHKTDEQVSALPISEQDKKAKFYFNEFWKMLKPEDVVIKTIEKLISEFQTFLKTKEDARQEVQ